MACEILKPIGRPLSGHKDGVTNVVFSPDDARIVSASHDMTLRIWPTTNNWTEQLRNKLTRNMSDEK